MIHMVIFSHSSLKFSLKNTEYCFDILLSYSLQVFHSSSDMVFFLLKSERQKVASDLQNSSKNPDFNNAVVWMVSILPLISSSPSLFSRFLETVLRAPTMIDITIIYHNFFSSLARSRYLVGFSPSFTFILCLTGMAKSSKWQVLFFLLIRFCLLVGIWWSVCISKYQRILFTHLISKDRFWFVLIPFFNMAKL